MDVDRAIEDLVVAVADFLEQMVARFHAALGAREREEQLELDGRERERLVAERRGARAGIDAQIGDDDFALAVRRPRGARAARRVTARSRASSSRVEKVFGR